MRGRAARDERTPVALLEKLAGDVNTNVRTGVAINSAAPPQLLLQLAEDTHQVPAERARDTLRRHHLAIDEGVVESVTVSRLVGDYTRKGRTDLIEVLEAAGMLDSVDEPTATECLFVAVLTSNHGLSKLWLSKGGDPYRTVRDQLSSVDVAKRFHSLSILQLIDAKGRHADFLVAMRQTFPVPKNLDYVGEWSNRMDGFSGSSMTFFKDGTGRAGAGFQVF